MLVSEIILLVTAITAAIVAIIRVLHKSKIKNFRSKCCNLIEIEETRDPTIVNDIDDVKESKL